MLVDHDPDDDVLVAAEGAADADAIAFANDAVRLGVLAVDLDLPALARTLGLRARLEQAGDVQPDVEADARRSHEDVDLRFCLQGVDERFGLRLAVLIRQVLLDLRLASSSGTTRAACFSATLMMWKPNCVSTSSLISPGLERERDLVEWAAPSVPAGRTRGRRRWARCRDPASSPWRRAAKSLPALRSFENAFRLGLGLLLGCSIRVLRD